MSAVGAPVVGRGVDREIAGGGEVDRRDRDGRGAGFVQRDGQVGAVGAVEQVDAVEARSRRRAGRSGVRMASNCVARLARTVVSEVCCAWVISAWADCTSLVIEVMPLLAAWIVLMPFAIESSRLPRSLARFCRPCAVKKLIGLSSAVLTRLPVASLVWVDVIRSEVFCNCSRLARTPAVRTISAHRDSP